MSFDVFDKEFIIRLYTIYEIIEVRVSAFVHENGVCI